MLQNENKMNKDYYKQAKEIVMKQLDSEKYKQTYGETEFVNREKVSKWRI